MLTISENEDFEKLIVKDSLTIVDFYADWCSPCRMLGKVMEEISKEDPTLDIVKVNVDKFGEIASLFRVSSIPAVFAIKSGKVVDSFVGYAPKETLLRFIQKNN